jgi:(p)ppGpp synthase/HD superfamily hydrolase
MFKKYFLQDYLEIVEKLSDMVAHPNVYHVKALREALDLPFIKDHAKYEGAILNFLRLKNRSSDYEILQEIVQKILEKSSKEDIALDLVTQARKIATVAHSGQYRRDGKTPYIFHLYSVIDKLKKECHPHVLATAWLHDVLEDTEITKENLASYGIPDGVIASVDRLTKKRGQSYHEYIELVTSDPIALKVKIADMLSNLGDEPTDDQIDKYAEGLKIAMNAKKKWKI